MSTVPHLARKLVSTTALVAALGGFLAVTSHAPTGFAAHTSSPVSAAAHVEPASMVAPKARQAAPRTSSVKAGAHANAYSRQAFRATNKARRDHGMADLRGNACLRKAALRQARAMARAGEIFHQDLGRIQGDCGVGWVGENVAAGYGSGTSVVVDGWMESEGHRANILSGNYNRMGLAAVQRDGRWWAAQVFASR